MTVLLVLSGVMLLIFLYFFFAPFYIEVNSITGLYSVRFHRLVSAKLRVLENTPFIELNIAGLKKRIGLAGKNNETESKKIKMVKKDKKKSKISFRKVIGVIKSFRINKFYMTIGFNDMALNGMLYPLFFWIGFYSGKNISINFMEENEINLQIKNNCARIVWAYIKS